MERKWQKLSISPWPRDPAWPPKWRVASDHDSPRNVTEQRQDGGGWRALQDSLPARRVVSRSRYWVTVSTVFFWCVVECVFYELYGDRPWVDKEIRFLQTAITFIEIFWRMSNNILFSVETWYLNVFSCFQKCGNEGQIYWQDDDECNLHSTFDLKM